MLFTITEKSTLLLKVLLVGIRTSRSKLINDDMGITTKRIADLRVWFWIITFYNLFKSIANRWDLVYSIVRNIYKMLEKWIVPFMSHTCYFMNLLLQFLLHMFSGCTPHHNNCSVHKLHDYNMHLPKLHFGSTFALFLSIFLLLIQPKIGMENNNKKGSQIPASEWTQHL